MTTLSCTIRDEISGLPVEAKVYLQNAGGEPILPPGYVSKVGPGLPGFYTPGTFQANLPPGICRVIVERGTEYIPWEKSLRVDSNAPIELEVNLQRWTSLAERGWYPGNTHIHYNQLEANPDLRIALDPKVHDLNVTVVSLLQRTDFKYASNQFPVGLLNELSTAHHMVDIGEECRHNQGDFDIGYGHVMFIRLEQAVLPVSRGLLVSEGDPDYPPLCYACDEAHRQGATVIWCHNGVGMEAPVAAALGKLDAFNLFDPYQWIDQEYTLWYHLLNCGFKLPASTGSDWFVCSNNRVYAQAGTEFSYSAWLDALKAGRSFITNGPALFLEVNGQGPDNRSIQAAGKPLEVCVNWESFYPLDTIELIFNGEPVARRKLRGTGLRTGQWERRFSPPSDGWLAVRAAGTARDSFFQPMFAHTSQVWIEDGKPSPQARRSAAFFLKALKNSQDWIQTRARFTTGSQLREMAALFQEGEGVYKRILGSGRD